jgi:hypothetical protein
MNGAVLRLGKAALDINLVPIVTVEGYPQNRKTVVVALIIANTDSSAVTVTLRYGTGTLTALDAIMEEVSIAAHTTLVLSESEGLLVLNAGEQLQGFASVLNKVVVSASGKEFT